MQYLILTTNLYCLSETADSFSASFIVDAGFSKLILDTDIGGLISGDNWKLLGPAVYKENTREWYWTLYKE